MFRWDVERVRSLRHSNLLRIKNCFQFWNTFSRPYDSSSPRTRKKNFLTRKSQVKSPTQLRSLRKSQKSYRVVSRDTTRCVFRLPIFISRKIDEQGVCVPEAMDKYEKSYSTPFDIALWHTPICFLCSRRAKAKSDIRIVAPIMAENCVFGAKVAE